MAHKELVIEPNRVGNILDDFTFFINSMPMEPGMPTLVEWYDNNELKITFKGRETETCNLKTVPENPTVWDEKDLSFKLIEM